MNIVVHIYLIPMANGASPEFVLLFFSFSEPALKLRMYRIQAISGKSVIVTSFSRGQGVALIGQ